MIRYAGAVVVAGLMGWSVVPAQPAPCGGPLADAQIARRRTLIGVARQINTGEAHLSGLTQHFGPLEVLKGVTVPDGFVAQLSIDGDRYIFSVKDTQDACRTAVFSDQDGIIYNAEPFR